MGVPAYFRQFWQEYRQKPDAIADGDCETVCNTGEPMTSSGKSSQNMCPTNIFIFTLLSLRDSKNKDMRSKEKKRKDRKIKNRKIKEKKYIKKRKTKEQKRKIEKKMKRKVLIAISSCSDNHQNWIPYAKLFSIKHLQLFFKNFQIFRKFACIFIFPVYIIGIKCKISGINSGNAISPDCERR